MVISSAQEKNPTLLWILMQWNGCWCWADVLYLTEKYITPGLHTHTPLKKDSYLKRVFSSRSVEGSSVIRLTRSCMQWSCERKRRSRWFCALHSCRRSSSSISSFRVTSSRSSSWSMWEVVCRSNFQNMAAAARGSTCLDRERRSEGVNHIPPQYNNITIIIGHKLKSTFLNHTASYCMNCSKFRL